ncbi:MAG: peptidyl-prolyl cis-trans isomerase [Candidatus Korobacteraceae bacterium]|jgi:peptidyl-prolyl cis-trans isomerase D
MIRFLQKPGPIKKIVLGGLLVVVCVMMVITLIPGGGFLNDIFGGGLTTQGVLARVGNQDIGVQEVAQQARRIAKQQFKGNVPPGIMSYIMPRAAESVIAQKMLVYEADRMGLGVSNEELSNALHQGQMGQVLFPGGKFIGEQEYEMLIQSQFNLSVAQFEQEVKAEIAQRKLLSLITAPVSVSDKDISQELMKHDTKVKFEYAVLTLDDIKKQIKPTDAELRAFYEQYKQQYANSIPEKRKAQYILIETAKLTDKISVTQAELQQYYNQHQDEYRIPETVTVRHILIKTPTPGPDGKVDQAGVDAARKKAEDIAKQLKAGGNFAELAKKNSDDPGSAQNGGLLPPLTKGRTVPEFEQAAFNTPVGQTTDIIRTSYGFHIIHVEAKQQARLKPLDEVTPEIEMVLKGQKASAGAQSLANAVQAQARTAGISKAAAEKGLTVTSVGPIAQGEPLPGVGNAPEFVSALFSAKKGDPPATAPLPQGYAVYQVTEIQPPQTPTFEQVQDKVEQQFKEQRAQAQLAQKTQQLADRAHAEHDLAKAAKEAGVTVKTSELVDRTSQVPEVGAMSGAASVAFDMKTGDISAPIQSGNNGVVIKVLEVQQPSPEQMKQNWDSVKDTLLQQKRNEIEGLYVENLRDRLEKEGKVRINKKEMERLSQTAEGS